MAQGPRHSERDVDPPSDAVSAPLARRLPSDVQAWAVFQPNAVGRGELRGREAFVQRQMLKSRGLCPAERMFVAVGLTEVVVWHALPGRFLGRRIGRWARDELFAEAVEPVGVESAWWPALRLWVRHVEPGGRDRLLPVAEVRALHHDHRCEAVADLLLRPPDP